MLSLPTPHGVSPGRLKGRSCLTQGTLWVTRRQRAGSCGLLPGVLAVPACCPSTTGHGRAFRQRRWLPRQLREQQEQEAEASERPRRAGGGGEQEVQRTLPGAQLRATTKRNPQPKAAALRERRRWDRFACCFAGRRAAPSRPRVKEGLVGAMGEPALLPRRRRESGEERHSQSPGRAAAKGVSVLIAALPLAGVVSD